VPINTTSATQKRRIWLLDMVSWQNSQHNALSGSGEPALHTGLQNQSKPWDTSLELVKATQCQSRVAVGNFELLSAAFEELRPCNFVAAVG
jgi:hypothetical protein